MSEITKQLELIQDFYSFVERVSDLLNTEIVSAVGIQADWEYWVGVSKIPEAYAENFSPERFKRLDDLWTLRESANGFCSDLSEYNPTEWAKTLLDTCKSLEGLVSHVNSENVRLAKKNAVLESDPLDEASDLVKANIEFRREHKFLLERIKTLEAQHAKGLNQVKESYSKTFTCFKADVIVCLKALELVAIASQRHGEIALNHHVRDMRLEHLQGIIINAIKDFSDRQLSTYDDDF